MAVSKFYTTFNIAGFTYWDGVDVIDELKVGTVLQLEAEPTNGYDANAVKILYGNTMLGYIPRTDNKDITKFLQLGHTDLFSAKISRIDMNYNPENQIQVTVRINPKK
ncbi:MULTISPECIES: HIRAN domain-containing protein [Capnocytophaga]|uniref:HIRAN domain-containing protein n=1 Tax=Capnocytophaga canis TaxID=1848903 RepID=A0A0B7HXM5_9FLAO|nr:MULTISPECIES: HIRAN domain-containing protein [Capnocytophaga]ATA72759.1 hypothetical protein CGC49_05300 [Capnocytophaga sp. H4358]ATA74854.1 hypothetical protein CGC52_05055 [Capnocytophaga sp. H2931]RIY35640.1 hypothetical protein CKY20_09700 [Capnocytophaga canis]CEN43344.1 HIRAN domain-containing protein [Capnocytophaga canis]CEN52208.1 HIRAN domain-containing protein [Capnocytophaga canis]